jgi:trk system potassium uptake protein TrkH
MKNRWGSIRVDWRAVLALVGRVLKWLTTALGFPLLVALGYGEFDAASVFLVTMAIALVGGLALERFDHDPHLGAREALLIVVLTWVAMAFVGALPYVLAGHGTLANPINALFESTSGFTTTGATVMGDISFETHSRSMLLWRQETQWLGGMGIVVLAVAILPELSVGGAQLLDAEAPGPEFEKLTPRIAETARALWLIYLGFTVLEIGLLYALHLAGLAPNMGLYNAVAHGLTTLPTGGFSPEARSIEAFSAVVQWVIIPFMVAAGVNFALFWRALTGELGALQRDSEFRVYVGVIAAITAILSILLFTGVGLRSAPPNVGVLPGNGANSIRHALFQAAAIVTTTGYASLDFNTWGPVAQYFLLAVMFVGGSAGSTGSAIKIVRWLVILRSIRRDLFSTIHPDAVAPVRLGGRSLNERAVRGIYGFTILYFVIFGIGTALVFLESTRIGLSLSVLETMSAVAATLGNVGPGFGAVGPMNSYLLFSAPTKAFMVLLMLLGRLELFPLLVLLTRSYWQS